MRPLCYSERDALERDIGWVRSGSRICYYQNLTRVLTTYYLLLTTDQVRSGSRICYYQNQYASQAPPKKRRNQGRGGADAAREIAASYYTLAMVLSFPHSGDTAYVAQCYPYTYTKLQKVVSSLVERRSACVRRETLTLTLTQP